ncbi:MAG: hypothetical protein BGO05_02220 [Rhizobiales bacterium 63-7]|nr:MAG: hypothetical protein BGO05_02220 [Rhizobiales bacterium 63-7]
MLPTENAGEDRQRTERSGICGSNRHRHPGRPQPAKTVGWAAFRKHPGGGQHSSFIRPFARKSWIAVRKRGQEKGNSGGRNCGRNESRGLFNSNDDIGISCKRNQRVDVIFQSRDTLAFFESGRKRICLRYSASNNIGAQIGKRQADHLRREITSELENTQTCQGSRLACVVAHPIAVGHPISTLSIQIDCHMAGAAREPGPCGLRPQPFRWMH